MNDFNEMEKKWKKIAKIGGKNGKKYTNKNLFASFSIFSIY